LNLIHKLFKCYSISVKTDSLENDIIFDYNDLMINENKENELLNENDKENNNNKIEYC